MRNKSRIILISASIITAATFINFNPSTPYIVSANNLPETNLDLESEETTLKTLELNIKEKFLNVSSMVDSDLKVHDIVETVGYYKANDGGAAKYILTYHQASQVGSKKPKASPNVG